MTQLTFTQSEFEEFKVFLENASPGAASRGLAWGTSYQVHRALGVGDPRRWLENGGKEAVAAYDAFKAYRRLAGPVNIRRSLQKLNDLAGGELTPVDMMETLGIDRKTAEQIELSEYTFDGKAAQKALAEQVDQVVPPAGDEPPADNEPGEDEPASLEDGLRAKFADLVTILRSNQGEDMPQRIPTAKLQTMGVSRASVDRVALLIGDPDLPLTADFLTPVELGIVVSTLQARVDKLSEDE